MILVEIDVVDTGTGERSDEQGKMPTWDAAGLLAALEQEAIDELGEEDAKKETITVQAFVPFSDKQAGFVAFIDPCVYFGRVMITGVVTKI